jgi:Domain of unknown function (DUF4383)
MCKRTLAIVFGLGFLAAGVMGAFHVGVQPYSGPPLAIKIGQGDLLGMFHVNLTHTIINAIFGIFGVAAVVKGKEAAKFYAQVVGVVFVILAVMGAMPWGFSQTIFGLLPIEGNDIWLHTAIGVIACFAGFSEKPANVEAVTCS